MFLKCGLKMKNFIKSLPASPLDWLFFILVLSLFLTIVNMNFFTIVNSDFVNYFVGAKMVREGFGESLYNPEANRLFQEQYIDTKFGRNILTFRSLPFVAIFFLPFTFFQSQQLLSFFPF